MHSRILLRWVTAGMFIALCACVTQKSPAAARITGTATYLERMLLPPDSRLEVTLQDESLADAPAEVIAQTYVDLLGAPPYKFTISYDPARIVANHRYAVRARILWSGTVLFQPETGYAVLGDAHVTHADVLLYRSEHTLIASPTATRMQGMYTYQADAGWFTDCATGARLPVAQEAANAALEADYARRNAGGAPLLATVDGHVEDRKPMEGKTPRPTLIVENFVTFARSSCDPTIVTGPATIVELENTYWKLLILDSVPAASPPGAREVHFVLQSEGKRVTGFAGCNRMMGSYTLNGAQLTFSQMGGTLMACTNGMELEKTFHEMFPQVASWKILGELLELKDAAGKTVATFEQRYMK